VSLLDEITTRGAEIRAQLRALLYRHEYPWNTKNLVLMAYVDIALEHHEAIWLLTDSKLYGPAFAMVRLVFDAYLRALWINRVATEQQIEQASQDEFRFPQMPQMRDDIKECYGDKSNADEMELLDKFFRIIKEVWKASSSYTHSGGLQLGRRFTEDQVKPNYSEADIAQALNLATLALLLQHHMFFVSMGCDKEVQEVLTLLSQHDVSIKQVFAIEK
jgi:uncharacterized protein DUF6988